MKLVQLVNMLVVIPHETHQSEYVVEIVWIYYINIYF